MAFCNPQPGQKEAVFKIKLSDYPALLESWGSVRVGINEIGSDEYPVGGGIYPIIINRDDQGNFYVLDSECRHASCTVPVFAADSSDPANGVGRITCPCHGSAYAIDGSLINGPAEHPLHTLPFEFDGDDTLTIRNLCWGVALNVAVMPVSSNSRIRLDFNTGANVFYEVNFRERLQDPWTPVNFATDPEGPADESSISSYFGDPVSVYVDRTTPTGFYAVSAQISEV